ncbi:hypothetical protein Tsubulata_000129 [Turnera subulata]|uniref:WRKY domain-containing protein n=1 Tax=Turnera subulata TaxID=218843 RepID=A0A9Q0J8Q3_9ROSI|nr:hypothetical protein Tsubulata_000129 [Turnera subulata]
MDPFWPENNLPSDRMKAVNELVQGREFANQLKAILNNPKGISDDGLALFSREDLVTKILNSFTNTLSILNRADSSSGEVSDQFPATSHRCGGRKLSEDSGESSKSSTGKDRRGCYKRRKTAHSWTKESSTLIEDGFAWRKYGQKKILDAKYPRNYYRCTHKFDQGCQATKQVQQVEEELYSTTYCGHHTCKSIVKASELFLDSADADSTIFLSFSTTKGEDNISGDNLDNPFFPSFQSIKQENNQDNISSNLTHHQYSSSSEYLVSPDLSTFDHADVISGVNSSSTTASAHGLDMGMMVGSVSFIDDVLQFEFAE